MKIPVFVLSGFLGSGKTTLLLHLLKEAAARSLKPAILMNELGKFDVDGQIIADSTTGISLEKLMDGCICCSKKSEVADSLTNLIKKNPDLIFIELTGVANPEEIADCLTEPQLLHKLQLIKIITLLDAENVLEYNSIFSTDMKLVHTLRRQIEVADLIIVNKRDLVNQKQLEKIEKAVRKQNPKAPLVFSTNSKIDLENIFRDLKPLEKTMQAFSRFQITKNSSSINNKSQPTLPPVHNHDSSELSYSRIQSIVLPFKPGQPITLKRLEQFLHKIGPQLLRAKGYLSLSAGEPAALMQYAAKRMTWEPSPYLEEQYVVFIGIDLDLQRLTVEWNAFAGQKTTV
jgi:G3E family GTPase